MVKAKKRKLPLSRNIPSIASSKPRASRNVIRRFHVLLKRQTQLKSKPSLGSSEVEELRKVEAEIEELGGLEWYQRMSAIGQSNDRGGGSEKILIGWLKGMNMHGPKPEKLKLLEVGALKPDNYKSCTSWVQNTPIDLHSRHPDIREQDFLLLDPLENADKWDIVSLSLVVNFVPDPKDRGRVLQFSNAIIKPSGFLFLVLPLPCVLNSRYMSFDHLSRLMEALGFTELKRRWKEGGKMSYWLYQKQRKPELRDFEEFKKKTAIRSGNRNNFCILLTPQ